MNKKQIERIEKMEKSYDRALAAVEKLNMAMEEYGDVLKDIQKLEKYYSSELWLKDYEADEAGQLPADLKRGVLSQDGLYDLLADIGELNKSVSKLFSEDAETE